MTAPVRAAPVADEQHVGRGRLAGPGRARERRCKPDCDGEQGLGRSHGLGREIEGWVHAMERSTPGHLCGQALVEQVGEARKLRTATGDQDAPDLAPRRLGKVEVEGGADLVHEGRGPGLRDLGGLLDLLRLV